MKPPLSATNLRQMLSNASSGGNSTTTTTTSTTTNTATASNTSRRKVGGGITYSKQDTLPLLPIPDLDITLQRLQHRLDALQQNEQQRQQTASDIEEFLTKDGPILYQKLREYEENGRTTGTIGSYVEEFWNEAYLQPDMSIVLNLNPYFVLESSPDPKMATNQLRRAASLTYAAIQMVSITKLELLVPDTFRNQPLCMHQFKSLFASSRQPTLNDMDDVHVFNDSTHGTCCEIKHVCFWVKNGTFKYRYRNVHTVILTFIFYFFGYNLNIPVVVLCKNQFYYFFALWPDNDDDNNNIDTSAVVSSNKCTVAVNESDIYDILFAIQAHASEDSFDDSGGSKGIGVFTSLPRSRWAVLRQEICDCNEAIKDRKSTRLNSSHLDLSRMPSSA